MATTGNLWGKMGVVFVTHPICVHTTEQELASPDGDGALKLQASAPRTNDYGQAFGLGSAGQN